MHQMGELEVLDSKVLHYQQGEQLDQSQRILRGNRTKEAAHSFHFEVEIKDDLSLMG